MLVTKRSVGEAAGAIVGLAAAKGVAERLGMGVDKEVGGDGTDATGVVVANTDTSGPGTVEIVDGEQAIRVMATTIDHIQALPIGNFWCFTIDDLPFVPYDDF